MVVCKFNDLEGQSDEAVACTAVLANSTIWKVTTVKIAVLANSIIWKANHSSQIKVMQYCTSNPHQIQRFGSVNRTKQSLVKTVGKYTSNDQSAINCGVGKFNDLWKAYVSWITNSRLKTVFVVKACATIWKAIGRSSRL